MATMSTPLKDALLDNGSLKSTMAAGFLHIYAFENASTIPGADDAVGTTNSDYVHIATIYSDGTSAGISFGTAASGSIQKASGETWTGDVVSAGTEVAAFFVHTASGESSGADLPAVTTEPRIVGSIGTSGADLNLSSVSLTSGQTQEITYYSVSLG